MRITMFVSLGVLALAPVFAVPCTPPNILIIIAGDLGTDKVDRAELYCTCKPQP